MKENFQVTIFGINQVSTLNLFFDLTKTIQDNLNLYLPLKFNSFKSFETSFVIVSSTKDDKNLINENEINTCVYILDKEKTRIILKNFNPLNADIQILEEKITQDRIYYIENDCRILNKSILNILQIAHQWGQFLSKILYFDSIESQKQISSNKIVLSVTTKVIIEYENKSILSLFSKTEKINSITKYLSFNSIWKLQDVVNQILLFGPNELKNSNNYMIMRNSETVNLNDYCGNFIFLKVEFY
jgi:hypothetical protein